jgi:uncharacterized membrane protein/protein-disulfide isomerase
MKRHARVLILVLAALGFLASVAALYVHYRMLNDPSYQSFCDVSDTVSCEAVLASRYSSLFGIPVAAGGAIWGALVLLLAGLGMRERSESRSGEVASYIFLLSTLGLAVVLYLGYASFFVIQKACPLCLTMYVSVIGTFIVSGVVASESMGSLPGRLGRDMRAVLGSPLAATLAVLWVVGSASLVAFFPRHDAAAAAETGAALAPAPTPTETLTDAQRTQFEQWAASQPRATLPVQADGAKVVVVKFNDFQCPACRQAYFEYRGIEEKWKKEAGDKVKFITMDFPLEAECNVGSVHPSACEAAAAVRMARAKGKGPEMEYWCFTHQDGMTPATIKEGLAQVAQVTDFDAQYQKELEAIRADAKVGQELGVNGTPTFFVNGIKVPSLRAVYFDALIAAELQRSEAPKTD